MTTNIDFASANDNKDVYTMLMNIHEGHARSKLTCPFVEKITNIFATDAGRANPKPDLESDRTIDNFLSCI